MTALIVVALALTNVESAAGLTLERPPLPTPQGRFDGVSCPSAKACMVVGLTYRHTDQVTRPLAEWFNGKHWKILGFPTGRANVQLNDVVCRSVRSCVAVGMITTNFDHPLAARWNGSRWTLQKTPWPVGDGSLDAASLWGVSCPSGRNCMAVGLDEDQGLPLAERWNGRSWAITRMSQPGTQNALLDDVSCTSVASCVAVGAQFAGCQLPYLERWNGLTWAIDSTPAIPGFDGTGAFPCGRQNDSMFSGVSCLRSAGCVTVGWRGVPDSPNDVPLVEESRSTQPNWLLEPFPSVSRLSGAGYLAAVSCHSLNACVAAGSAGSGNRSVAMLADLRGGRWTIQPVATRTSTPRFNDIACPTPRWCLAVGTGWNRHHHETPLAAEGT